MLGILGVGTALLVSGKVSNASEVDFLGKSSQCSCAEFSPQNEQNSLDFGTIFVACFSGGTLCRSWKPVLISDFRSDPMVITRDFFRVVPP